MKFSILLATFFLSMKALCQNFNKSEIKKTTEHIDNQLKNGNIGLGDYISIKDHPKSKDVNLKIKVPIGWEIKEGDRPNIVKKFTDKGNTYLILIKDNISFFSRKQIKEILQEKDYVENFVQESISFLKNPQVLSQSVVTIDTYPSIEFKVKGKMERTGLTFLIIMKCWVVFYEDKIIFFQGMGVNNLNFTFLEQLFSSITNSVIFPEQYE